MTEFGCSIRPYTGCSDLLANDSDADNNDILVISDLQIPSGSNFFSIEAAGLCYNILLHSLIKRMTRLEEHPMTLLCQFNLQDYH